jgi:hypothetical protein
LDTAVVPVFRLPSELYTNFVNNLPDNFQPFSVALVVDTDSFNISAANSSYFAPVILSPSGNSSAHFPQRSD